MAATIAQPALVINIFFAWAWLIPDQAQMIRAGAGRERALLLSNGRMRLRWRRNDTPQFGVISF
jgi:hypothetical protein